ncbi:MAG: DNA internalization-related competence protein ComEC/Rec2 [Actinobacteria bacterium]|nr:DNA internalization-related competence protein ComEC/Rec2 [Actinomycetota bacterium]
MNAWLLPLVAGSFWAGLLAEGAVGLPGPGWATLGVGLALLVATGAAHPPGRRGPHPLEAAGLVAVDPDPVPSLPRPGRPLPPRAPPALLAVALALSAALVGAGWGSLRSQRPWAPLLAEVAGRPATLVGTLRADPASGPFGWSAPASVGRLEVAGGGPALAGGVVLVEGHGEPPEGARFDRVEVTGSVAPAGPEGFLARVGADALFRASSFRRLGPSSSPPLRLVQAVRAGLQEGVSALFGERDAGLLLGLTLGDTSRLDPAVEEDFRATGLGHLLAVSGQNVAMVLAPVIGLAILLRLPARARFFLGSATVLLFVLLTAGEPSVLRAGVMAVITMAGVLFGRPRSSASVLALAVLVLLVADPVLASALGFQLSVAATGGILALASPLAGRLAFLPRPVALALATTLAAQAGVWPLLLARFHLVPLTTIPANLLALPAVAPALLVGLAAAAAWHLAAPLGHLLAGVAGLFLGYLRWVADRFASLPLPSITSLEAGAGTIAVGLALVGGLAWWLRSGRRVPRTAAVAAALVLPLFVWASALRAGPPAGLVVRFLDVGQGDAALLQTPDGAEVLIDGGPDGQLVATKLAALGVKRIDLLVATHAHADHVAGLPAVLTRFPVGLVVEPGCASESPAFDDFRRAVREEGVPVHHPRTGEVLSVGLLRLEVLSPPGCFTGTESDANNDSIVLRAVYLEDVVLFTGDAEVPAQELLLDSGAPLAAEVLKVPHHGGATSMVEFLVAVDPVLAVVSVGQPNDYGHPVPSIVEALEAAGATVLRTDLAGDVVVRFHEEGVSVESRAG